VTYSIPPRPSSTPRCIENYIKFKFLKRGEIFQTLVPNLQIFQNSVQIHKYSRHQYKFTDIPEFSTNLQIFQTPVQICIYSRHQYKFAYIPDISTNLQIFQTPVQIYKYSRHQYKFTNIPDISTNLQIF